MSDVWNDEWLEGYEACVEGITEWECPYADGTYAAMQWLSGWRASDFDDRAADVIGQMETHHGFQ